MFMEGDVSVFRMPRETDSSIPGFENGNGWDPGRLVIVPAVLGDLRSESPRVISQRECHLASLPPSRSCSTHRSPHISRTKLKRSTGRSADVSMIASNRL
jgi:hypothetical protein